MTIPSTMRAAVLGKPGEIEVVPKAIPPVGRDEVLVKVHSATLCGTDLKIRDHKFFGGGSPPTGSFTPGHEYAGVVAAVGDSVDEFIVGDRVVTEAHRGCMRCINCLGGAPTDCLNYGQVHKGHRTQGMTVDGGFAEYVTNHVSTLHHLPENIGLGEAAVLTTVGTVMHGFDVVGSLLVGARVAIIGPGAVGLLAVQVARELGADFVALAGTRDQRLAIGRSFGADLTINVTEGDPVDAVREATAGVGVDVVLECSGAPSAVDQALQMTRRGGVIVLVGFFDSPVTASLNHAVMNGITLRSIRGEGVGAVARATALGRQGRINLAGLVTHHYPLEKIAEAFDTYADKQQGAIKVMIDMAES